MGASDHEGRAFTAMWEQHAPRIMAYALRHVDPDTAQEVLAETFLVAWRRLRDVPGQPLPWLLVVALTPSPTTAAPATADRFCRTN